MAKGATSKKKREEENRQNTPQRNPQQREETRQRQQRTQSDNRTQSRRNETANSRQTTRREVAPAAIPVFEERSAPQRNTPGRNVAQELFPEHEPQQTTSIPVVEPIQVNNKGQGFQADLDQRMREYYNNGTPIARHTAERAQERTERPVEPQMEEPLPAIEKGRKDAQRRTEAQAKSASKNGQTTASVEPFNRDDYAQTGLTAKAQADIKSIDSKLNELNNYQPTGDAGVDEVMQIRNQNEIAELQRKREEILKTGRSEDDYAVTREDYDSMMQNPELANDISTLEEITRNNQLMGVTVDPNGYSKILTGMSVDEYYDYLENKYGLSREELSDMTLTNKADKINEQNTGIAESFQKFGEKHPVAGSVASLYGTLGGAVEGAYNLAVGTLTDDDRYLSTIFNKTKEGLREGAKENIVPELGKGVYDFGMNAADLIPAVLSGNAPLMFAGNAANRNMLGAVERGQNVRKSAGYGAVTGAIEYYLDKVGLDAAKAQAMSRVAGAGAAQFLKRFGIAAGTEALENVIQEGSDMLIDELMNDDKSELRTAYADRVASGMSEKEAFDETVKDFWARMGSAAGTGALMGGMMMGGHTLKNEAQARILYNRMLKENGAMAKQNEIDVNAKVDNVNQTVDKVENLAKQADAVTPKPEKVEWAKLNEEEQSLFDDLVMDYDGTFDGWKRMRDRALEYIYQTEDTAEIATRNELASRVYGEIERLDRESKELINLGGTPTWTMPRPSQQLDGVAARINQTLDNVPLDDENIAKESANIRKAIDDYKSALDGDSFDAINQARKDLYNACKRFDNRAKKISLEGYDGLFGKKSFSYNTPQSMGVGSPQKLWQNIADAEENNRRLLAGEEPDDTLGRLLNGETLEETAKTAPEVPAVQETADMVKAETADTNIPKMTEPEMAEVVDEIPTVNAAQAESDAIAKLGYNPNDPYVQDPNAIRKNQIPARPGSRNSKLGTNTMRTLDGAEQNAEDLSRGLYSYVPKEEQETMRIGAQRVIESPNKAYNDILNTADDAFTAEDVDTSMMLRNKIKQDLALAREGGDQQTINYLQSQLDALTLRQRKAATNAGQVSQAWAKWSRDADGATFAAYNIAARQYDDALKNNPRLGEIMKESTDELWEQLANADLDKESVESLSSKIQDMLHSIINKNGNAKIKRNFQDANIKKLSDTLAVQMKHNEDIGETLDMIEQAGVTGFTGLDDSVEQEVRELFDQADMFGYKSKQRIELEDQAYAKLAQALNLTGGIYDKLDTIRYFAMLANPKTHLRNVIGNYTFGEITNFKDQLAGLLEEGVDRASLKHGGEGIDRTTTFIRKNGADRNLHNATLNDFEENAYADLVGDKYATAAQGIEGNKNVFGYGKVGSTASDTAKANSTLLELEDVAAKRRKYADSLTRYLKANGYDESILKNDVTDAKTLAFLEEARAHAIGEAQKATFNQENWLANKFSKFSKEARDINWSEEGAGKRAHKVIGLFLDATVPFKRTPMNIITSLWDYQPAHLARFGVDIADIARHKPKAVNKLIDDLAKEMTGASLLAAGWGLAKSGFITGREDEETGELDALTGKQDYALNLGPLGSYTLDWLSPSLTILLAGANLAQSGLSAEGFTQMLADIGEPVLETTMLSSLVDVLRSAQYADDEMDTIQQAVATAAKNYVSQFVPTELGNIARSTDNTRRSTYTDKTGVSGIVDRAKKSIINKIPGLSETSQPYINRWGDQEQNYEGPGNDNLAARLAYNHLSPGYYSSDNTTDKDEYLYNLYEQLSRTKSIGKGEPSTANQVDQEIFPQAFSSKITENGVQRKVTPEEKTMKDTVEGNARDAFITAMANSEEIRSLPAETQAAIAKDMYEVAKLAGNASIIKGYTSTNKGYNTYLAGQQSKEGRTGVEDLLRYEIQKYTMKDAGISTSSNVSASLGELYDKDPEYARQMTDNVSTLVSAGVSSAGQDTYVTRGINFLGNIDPAQYADTWNAINSNEGNTDEISQKELKNYFADNQKQFTNQAEMFKYWGAYLTDFDPAADKYTVPYLKDDGTIGTHTATDEERELMQSILKEDNSSEQKTTETQTHTLPVMNVNLGSTSQNETQAEPVQETTQNSGDWLDQALSDRPQAEEIPSVQNNAQYSTIDDVWTAMKDANLSTSGASPYWKQAAAQGATPQQFYEYYNAIDSALGTPNGGISKDEWAKYLNDNGLPYDKDMEIIRMLYNTGWAPLRYSDETWYAK